MKTLETLPHGIELCRIPAGGFIRGGHSAPDEAPRAEVWLDEFLIGRTPVTNAQYRPFVAATGHRPPPLLDDAVFGRAEHPVVGVSWPDAVAYGEWLSSVSGARVGLPTEAQWEKSARGVEGRTYTWGDGPPRPELLNAGGGLGATSPVGAFPTASPFGLVDALGNVWEWCSDWYGPYEADAAASATSATSANPTGTVTGTLRTTRGGSWRSDLFRVTCHHRCFMNAAVRSDRHGFRIAVAASADEGPGPKPGALEAGSDQ
jgi:formylglycine-generating enzyme required for sulfatase activity